MFTYHYQTNYSILEHSIQWWDVRTFVSISYSLESHKEWCGNYVILHHANDFFIAEDNISWHQDGPLKTDSLENLNLSQGYKIDYIL